MPGARLPSVGQDRLILTRLRSGDRKLQELSIDIKVLTDLENARRVFYRHEGLHGPKDVSPLHPEPLSKRTTGKLSAHFAGSAQHPKSKPQVRKDLHVYRAPDREEL